MGGRPRQGRRRRPRARPHARQDLRLRLPVQERVPLRQDRHADQARPRQLRRHRHHLLLVVAGNSARRDRLRVPGQRDRRALHAAHQRVREGAGAAGAAVPPLVRPHQGLPHLLHHLEPAARHIRGGRHGDQGLQEPRGAGRVVPQEPADAAVREPVERRRLGHAGRPGQDRLEQGAVRRLLPQLQRRRVRHVGRRAALPRGHNGGLRGRRRRQLVEPGAQRHGVPPHAVGAEEVHDLQLLHRPQAGGAGRARRVQAPLMLRPSRSSLLQEQRMNPEMCLVSTFDL